MPPYCNHRIFFVYYTISYIFSKVEIENQKLTSKTFLVLSSVQEGFYVLLSCNHSVATAHLCLFTKNILVYIKNTLPFNSNLCSSYSYGIIYLSSYSNCWQSCIGWLTFILHRMEVMSMNNKFDFKDLIQFGMFIIALLTFIYLICH